MRGKHVPGEIRGTKREVLDERRTYKERVVLDTEWDMLGEIRGTKRDEEGRRGKYWKAEV